MTNILLTGAASFIESHILKRMAIMGSNEARKDEVLNTSADRLLLFDYTRFKLQLATAQRRAETINRCKTHTKIS